MTVGFSPTLYCCPMLFATGNPFKCHEEVLYLQLLIPPKRFDIFFPPNRWMLRRSKCVLIFLQTTLLESDTQQNKIHIFLCGVNFYFMVMCYKCNGEFLPDVTIWSR